MANSVRGEQITNCIENVVFSSASSQSSLNDETSPLSTIRNSSNYRRQMRENVTKTSDYSSGSSEAASESEKPVRIKRMTMNSYWLRHHCHFCPYIAQVQRKLTRHLVHHDRQNQMSRYGDRLNLCSYCSFTTIRKDHMKVHVRLHFNVVDYMYKKGFRVHYGRFWDVEDSISCCNVDKKKKTRTVAETEMRTVFKYNDDDS